MAKILEIASMLAKTITLVIPLIEGILNIWKKDEWLKKSENNK